ncbi:MAG: hypothetical protein GF315_02475 [candidate division Zixibacteria bacterium]|nr:hypothetical protein [candidate division Zixibacteria bacterium]
MLRRILNRARKESGYFGKRLRDYLHDSRRNFEAATISYSALDIDQLDISRIDRRAAEYLCDMYLNHRFDLLGSGWVKNSYNSVSPGLEGYKYDHNLNIRVFDKEGCWLKEVVGRPYVNRSKDIWKDISKDYDPIDWQRDFKSGYRWSAKRWYKDQPIGKHPGADAKVPWELARMQHLPQLAIFALIIPQQKEILIREFKNETLDFFACNPPNMGINWACTMDVAIRATNLLLAYDLFTQLDGNDCLTDEFKKLFADNIYHHGEFIVNNLEWHSKLTGNHYLANIVGLLYISTYLQPTEETSAWLAFSVQELIDEFDKQFYDDGGNYEASTFYHCLSLEMVLYATALIIGLDAARVETLRHYNPYMWAHKPALRTQQEQKYSIASAVVLPGWYISKFQKATKLVSDLTKPNGDIPQIGDNDSGCLFKFSPNGVFINAEKAKIRYTNLRQNDYEGKDYFDENQLSKIPLLSGLNGLLNKVSCCNHDSFFPLESSVVRTLSKGYGIDSNLAVTSDGIGLKEGKTPVNYDDYKYKQITSLQSARATDIPMDKRSTISAYPDSGIYIFRSDRVHLTICATPNGQEGFGGHAHNDKLSFELNLDSEDVIVDPGSYIYSASSERRNQFRSVKSHSTIIVDGEEQNRWMKGRKGLFRLSNETSIELLEATNNRIILKLQYRDVSHIRIFQITHDRILIYDYCNKPFKCNFNTFDIYSPGYGKLVNTQEIRQGSPLSIKLARIIHKKQYFVAEGLPCGSSSELEYLQTVIEDSKEIPEAQGFRYR